jgi:ABC-type Fe3+ transport system permease subunit
MAGLTAVLGSAVVFAGAYLVEKTPRFRTVRGAVQFLALLPLAVPRLVLGLGYIFLFNAPGNPLGSSTGRWRQVLRRTRLAPETPLAVGTLTN